MAMDAKLSVAFLWHMHQPMYKDFITGEYYLPWVRLHATYSYLDMITILDEFPEIKGTFNLTPSLIWQLMDIAEGGDSKDKYLELTLKKAEELTDSEKAFILKNFFSCDLEKAITPLKKYHALFLKRGNDLREEKLIRKSSEFTTQEMRDLQVFFNLAWCGFTMRKKNKVVKDLFSKGGGFSEGEKKALIGKQKEVVSSILPLYKKKQDDGDIEITTTPYYHPILPLLCGKNGDKGYDFHEDAKVHITKAVNLYKNTFGKAPKGMWPAEGSVSQSIVPLLADAGVKWIATDEGILLESFAGEGIPRGDLIYKAFQVEKEGKKLDIVFRDVNLSNAISFKYANMPAKKAAEEFISNIDAIAEYKCEAGGRHIVAVILDGENPWPYFADGGHQFLSLVYKELSSSKKAVTSTVGQFLAESGERKNIDKLHAGSWINRDFSKWIGSEQKNKAWHYLEKARKELMSTGDPSKEALEELYIAEGSDWFWWYDDFGSELNFVFDDIYRKHLSNIYDLMGRTPPEYLSNPIHGRPSVQEIPAISGPSEMVRMPSVLFVSSEVVPFAKTGGLADVSGSLPKELASLGCDVQVIMPLYKCVSDSKIKMNKESGRIRDAFMGEMLGFNLHSYQADGVKTYFIERNKYFDRPWLYGTPKGDYSDNALRFSYFSRAVLSAIKSVDFRPDIIHCNDWQSALIPLFLKFKLGDDDFYRGIKTLFTIHNMAYQGIFDRKFMKKTGIPENLFNMSDIEFYGNISFMKAGALYSDAVSTVSRRYAEEIMTPEYGCGLDGLMRARKKSLYGIPNGVDYSIWSPRNDKFIKTNFDKDHLDKKKECKKDLLEYTKLSIDIDKPLIGCVTRLAQQKGMDILANIMDKVVELGAGVVILGRGSVKYNKLFSELSKKYSENVYVCNAFNDELAHKIEAGCDIFLMPSRYEPCGLNQMYSIKYGTIPVVRATGGLDDVIVDIDEDREKGNGFKFGPATEDELYKAIKRAVDSYENKDLWNQIVKSAMGYDFSWTHSAKQYLALYKRILSV